MKPYYEHGGVVIFHGDSREVMPHVGADVLVTDPPYGIGYRSGWSDAMVANDESSAARDAAIALWGGRPALVFGRWSVKRPAGVRALLIWDKGDWPGMGDLEIPWGPSTEEIYVIGRGFTGKRTGQIIRDSKRRGGPSSGRFHPTEKPVGLMETLISRCPPGVVIDPFMGSGSTIVAAKNLGRRSIGIELEERYCEVAARRLDQEVLFGTPQTRVRDEMGEV